MSAFTPGPWFASREMEDDYGFQYCTVGPFDTSDRPDGDHVEDTIAEVRGINHHANANARLIAAAPDLLEALNQASGYLRNAAIDLQTGASKKTALATINGGLNVIRSAIKKAEGA